MAGKPKLPPTKLKRLDRLLSNLGYCSRSEVVRLLRAGVVTRADGVPLAPDDKIAHGEVLFDGEVLDPERLYLMLHKSAGCVCSRSSAEGESVFSFFPERFLARNPQLACVGRLDVDTTGLLLLSDDGDFLHRITAPRTHTAKVYEVALERPLRGDEQGMFEAGGMMLDGEREALLPVEVEVLDLQNVRMTLYEGRYHQVKRMWEQVGNKVVRLHRSRIGPLSLEGLAEGRWRELSEAELALHRSTSRRVRR